METTQNNLVQPQAQNQTPYSDPTQSEIVPQPQPKKLNILIFILVGAIGLILVGMGGYYLGTMSSKNTSDEVADSFQDKVSQKNGGGVECAEDARVCPDGSSVARVAPDCEFEECPSVVAEESLVGEQVYKIVMSSDRTDYSTQKDLSLKSLILAAVDLPEPPIKDLQEYIQVFYSIPDRESYLDYRDLINHEYYFLISENIKENKYSYDGIEMDIKKESTSLIPFLEDSKYCKEDLDCVIRADFCSIGAFNQYHKFHEVWGCGAPGFEGFEGDNHPETQVGEGKLCSTYKIEYDGTKCIQNKCVAQNPSTVCE